MPYQEKNFQREFGKRNEIVGLHELKITKLKSIAFSRLEDHQERALLGASGPEGCYHKISDFSLERKPADCFLMKSFPAYVVVMFYELRKKKMVYYITVRQWLDLRKKLAPRKSAKELEIAEIATHTFNYLTKT